MARSPAIVLLSGGLDSAFNLWAGRLEYTIVRALTFDYGQRAAAAEIRTSQRLAASLGVEHQVLDVRWFKHFTKTALCSTETELPLGADVAIDELATSQQTAKTVWVPNRNGVFLNIAAAFAEGLGAQVVLTGLNAEEAVTFADNSVQFLDAINESLKFSTASQVVVRSLCATMTKTEIVRSGRAIGLPLSALWPCYQGGEEWCGQCESCQRFARAVREAGRESLQDLGMGCQ